jgi:hypothetical protein
VGIAIPIVILSAAGISFYLSRRGRGKSRPSRGKAPPFASAVAFFEQLEEDN